MTGTSRKDEGEGSRRVLGHFPLMVTSTDLVLPAESSLLSILAPPCAPPFPAVGDTYSIGKRLLFLFPTSRLAPPFPAKRCVHSFSLETPIGRRQFNAKTKHPHSYRVQDTYVHGSQLIIAVTP